MGTKIIFYIVAGLMILFSILSVSTTRVIRAAVYLLFVMMLMGGIYFLFGYNFLAGVQLTVYSGGIAVLIVIAVLLVHNIDHRMEKIPLIEYLWKGSVLLGGSILTIFTINQFPFKRIAGTEDVSVSKIGTQLLSLGEGGFILPFEVISILLLAVMVAAIIIAKGEVTKNEEK